jgi:hypothetical protein
MSLLSRLNSVNEELVRETDGWGFGVRRLVAVLPAITSVLPA